MTLFDFDHDGELDPFELAFGASVAGAIGYGAALSEAEDREYRLRDEYEGQLREKQDRIDELEHELEDRHNDSYTIDDYFEDTYGFNDDDDDNEDDVF